jgi:amphiphysin
VQRTDYDRHNNALTKLRDKKEKSLSDERNLYKVRFFTDSQAEGVLMDYQLEQDFEVSTSEYDYVNNSLKNDLPQFLDMSVRFIEPLFQSFYYMQLNIYYVLLEKMTTFAEGKYDITSIPSTQIIQDYEEKRTDASQRIDNLNIIKKILSVCTSSSYLFSPTSFPEELTSTLRNPWRPPLQPG